MPEQNNIELRSEEVREIVGTPPGSLVRSGITVIFIVLFVLFTGSFFFKYPDIILARLMLTGKNPPADIKARTNGKITSLFVSDQQKVKENEVLAILENTGNYNDILSLKNDCEMLSSQLTNHDTIFFIYEPKSNLQLGTLQNIYSQFVKQLSGYKTFIDLDFNGSKIENFRKQIPIYKQTLATLEKQVQILNEDLVLVTKQYNRDSMLMVQQVIAEPEFENTKSIYLQKRFSFQSTNNNISSTEILITNLEHQIVELQLQQEEQKKDLETGLIETFENIVEQIPLWEQTYLLKSPIAGIVSFTQFWSTSQNCTLGETIFTIVPQNKNKLTAYAKLPIMRAGKVKKGQNINIKFDDYPYTEYGMVRAKIDNISLVSSDDFYTVRVSFPDSLTTNYKLKLTFRRNMQGDAEIITEDLPFIVRLINPLKAIFFENI